MGIEILGREKVQSLVLSLGLRKLAKSTCQKEIFLKNPDIPLKMGQKERERGGGGEMIREQVDPAVSEAAEDQIDPGRLGKWPCLKRVPIS